MSAWLPFQSGGHGPSGLRVRPALVASSESRRERGIAESGTRRTSTSVMATTRNTESATGILSCALMKLPILVSIFLYFESMLPNFSF